VYQAGKMGLKSARPERVLPQLDQSEAVLAADYKLSPVAQVILDRNGCIRRINIAAAVLLKGDPAQLTDLPFIAFVEKSDCHLFLDHLAQATSGTKKISTRLALSSATRALGPVELRTTSSIDTVTGWVFCRTAIVTLSSCERTQANGLWANKNGYEEWFELFPDAAILELGGKIISANPGALRLLGARSSDQIRGDEIFGVYTRRLPSII
jgi:hypothetical protein